jgi:polyphosphate glucokinase
MIFIGLGTGLGSTLIANDVLIPLELGWLRFDTRRSLLQQLADNGPQRLGMRRWRRDVISTLGDLKAAFAADEVVLGGGNAVRVEPLPRYCRSNTNAHAMLGAIRLWGDPRGVIAEPRGSIWEISGLRSRRNRGRRRRHTSPP